MMGVLKMLMFYLIFLPTVNGFLLNQQSNGGQTIPANQYMTLSKFMEEEKRLQLKMENLHQDTFTLRHDMDNSFVVLTAQLQQKLDLLDTKLDDIEKNNATNRDVLKLVEKNKILEQSYNDLKNENAMLQTKYYQIENELQLVKNNSKHRDELQTGLYNDVRTNFSILVKETTVLRNKSMLVDQEISNLKQLGSIQPLQEIKTLQQTVQTISAQTNSLSMKERARSQDFLALYNMTTNSLTELELRTQSKIKQLENDHINSVGNIDHRVDNLINETRLSQYSVGTQLSNIQSHFTLKFEETEKRNNLTFAHLNDIEKKSEENQNRHNLTFSRIQQQIKDSTEQVAMTAQLTSDTSARGILKFDNIIFSVGINNLAVYKRTGKFVCESKGLYMISSSIMADNTGAQFHIYLNGKIISQTFIVYNSNNPSTMRHTGTVVLVLQLLPNDSLWLYSPGSVIEGRVWSTLTILKVR